MSLSCQQMYMELQHPHTKHEGARQLQPLLHCYAWQQHNSYNPNTGFCIAGASLSEQEVHCYLWDQQ